MEVQPIHELWALDPSERVSLHLSADLNAEEQSNRIMNVLSQDIFLVRMKQLVWEQIQAEEESEEMKVPLPRVKSVMEETCYRELLTTMIAKIYEEAQVHEAVHRLLPNQSHHSRQSHHESLDSLRGTRQAWENGILDELQGVIAEARRPCLLVRPPGTPSPFLLDPPSSSAAVPSTSTAGGDWQSPDGSAVGVAEVGGGGGGTGAGGNGTSGNAKFLFDSEDFLETILAIPRSINLKTTPSSPLGLGLVPLAVGKAISLEELVRRYPELSGPQSQLGLDEGQTSGGGLKVLIARQEEAEEILASHSMLAARKFMRRGVPPSMRGKIWRLACGLCPLSPPSITSSSSSSPTATPSLCTTTEEVAYRRLRYEVDRCDLITDELAIYDVQTVLDDPRYFVFDEILKEALLVFARDNRIRDRARYEVHAPLLKEMMLAGYGPEVSAPPSGVLPYLGLTTYFAPLCYLYTSKPTLYGVSRYLWSRLWCRLNVVAADDGCIVSLCGIFESLLSQMHGRLFLHLVSLGVQPIKIAFNWMQLAFVGLLEVEQVLHLWDRVIGYMDPTLLAVTAVAIFLYRSEMLLRCTHEADVLSILTEGSRLHIVPLLQIVLLRDPKA